MIYYDKYIEAYQRDTAELSLTEHGAYTMLMDAYYLKESPLPSSIETLCRVCRAFGKAEQQAVLNVANLFFPIQEDGLRHSKMADAVISEYQDYMNKCKENGKKGGRPRSKKSGVFDKIQLLKKKG